MHSRRGGAGRLHPGLGEKVGGYGPDTRGGQGRGEGLADPVRLGASAATGAKTGCYWVGVRPGGRGVNVCYGYP